MKKIEIIYKNGNFRADKYSNWNKNFTEGLSYRLELAEERINKLQDRLLVQWGENNTGKQTDSERNVRFH